MCIAAHGAPRVIVFDLGGVLISYSKRKIGQQAPLRSWLSYMLRDGINPLTLRSTIFDILCYASYHGNARKQFQVPAHDEKGNPLPSILCELQCGITPARVLRERIRATIEKLALQGYFVSKHERIIIESILNITFDPMQFAAQFKPLKLGVDLVNLCHHAHIQTNGKSPKIIVLSNFDPESFEYLYHSPVGRTVFEHIPRNNIVISGMFKHSNGLKPNNYLFDYIIKKCGVAPHEIIMIDDQQENLAAAAARGMRTIKFDTSKPLKTYRRILMLHGIKLPQLPTTEKVPASAMASSD